MARFLREIHRFGQGLMQSTDFRYIVNLFRINCYKYNYLKVIIIAIESKKLRFN